jgi:tetratricopeptide (TPR) repeat protein
MIGELYSQMGDLEKAESFFNQAVLICKHINAIPELASAYYNLGLLYKQKRHRNKTREYLRQAQELYYSIDTSVYQKIKQELLELTQEK